LPESVGRAVLPLLTELGRGYEPIIAKALPIFVEALEPQQVPEYDRNSPYLPHQVLNQMSEDFGIAA
jgi:hypothetical protein